MATPIRHEPERTRFVAEIDGAEAVLEYGTPAPGVRDYHHTFVPPALRGRGLATELVEFALEDARTAGVRVIASCPFVARVTSADASYDDIVAR